MPNWMHHHQADNGTSENIDVTCSAKEDRQPASLRLGHTLRTLRPALHNGPGWRVALWLQGCSLRCTSRCLNPQFLSPVGGLVYSLEAVQRAIAETVKRAVDQVEGITILGGEPTDQAESLAVLLEWAQSQALGTMVYSGHTLEKLQCTHAVGIQRLLAATDLLVDGPYQPEHYQEDLAWRGSANQRILHLSNRYNPRILEAAWYRQHKAYSIAVDQWGAISISGFQDRSIASALEKLVQTKR